MLPERDLINPQGRVHHHCMLSQRQWFKLDADDVVGITNVSYRPQSQSLKSTALSNKASNSGTHVLGLPVAQ